MCKSLNGTNDQSIRYTPGGIIMTDTATKNEKTIADYLGDLISVETHIEQALDHQLNLTKDDETAGPLVQEFHDTVRDQLQALKDLQKEKGTTAGNPVIAAATTVLGKAAGVIDMIRTEGISKALRDDNTAFNLAAVSYSMFYVTASGLGDQTSADLAEKHLRAYASAIQKLNHVLPKVVLNELANDDHQVDFSVLSRTRTRIENAWRSTGN
jgi:ferritin-like metal-binding protein YciE